MEIQVAAQLIEAGVKEEEAVWADLGAGTGTFTQALQQLLSKGKVYAVDKSPHALWRLPNKGSVPMEIVDADFTRALDLPPLDGILMANALHYVADPAQVLPPLLQLLKPSGTFILVEYLVFITRIRASILYDDSMENLEFCSQTKFSVFLF